MLIRTILLSLLLCLTIAARGAEPTVAFNGWTNVPGVVQGEINVHGKPTATSTNPPMGYVDYLPKGYDPTGTDVWPVVFYLAGAGEMYSGAQGYGTSNSAYLSQLTSKMETHGPLYQVTANKWDFPCIVIAAQSTTTARWNSAATIQAIVTYVLANYRCDPKRIYMTGLCEGGSGTLRYAAAQPTVLGAIMPIIAIHPPTDPSADYLGDAHQLIDMPMWVAHAFMDVTYPRRNSILWVDKVTAEATGSPSNVMANYPSYNNPNSHYAADAGVDGKPLAWGGSQWSFTNAAVTNGSTQIVLSQTLNSTLAAGLSGTDAKPFAQVRIGNPPSSGADTRPIYIAAGASSSAKTITLTQPYAGSTSSSKRIDIRMPSGANYTAHQDPGTGAWIWDRNQPVGPGLRLLSMYWYEAHSLAWKIHYNTGEIWDWMFRQHRNTAPTITATPNQTVVVGRSGTVQVDVADAENEESMSFSISTDNGALLPTLSIDNDGLISFTAATGAGGTAQVTVRATDDYGVSDTDTFTITVAPNVGPTITPPADFTMPHTTTQSKTVTLADDHDAASTLTLSATSSNTDLIPDDQLVLSGSGASRTIAITPLPHFGGSAVITLSATDTDGAVSTATFTVTVTPDSIPIVGDIDDQTMVEDRTLAVPFLIGDDADPDDLTVTVDSSDHVLLPLAGLNLSGSGTNRALGITPAAHDRGTATVTITVSDSGAQTHSESFAVTVTRDLAPTITPLTTAFSVTKGMASAPLPVTVGDDYDGPSTLTLTASAPVDITVTLGGSGAERTVVLTPDAGMATPTTATVTLRIEDAYGHFSTEDLTVTVVDDSPPTLSQPEAITVIQGRSSDPIALTVIDDHDADPVLTGSAADAALLPPASIVLDRQSAGNWTLTVSPPDGQAGTTTLTITATDSNNLSSTRDVTVTVEADANPTLAALSNLTLLQDRTSDPIPLVATDDRDEINFSATSSDATLFGPGTLIIDNVDQTLTVAPAAGEHGTATVTVTVTDDGGNSASRTFTVTVGADEDPTVTGDFSDRTLVQDGLPLIFPVTIGDDLDDVGDLVVSFASSDTAVLAVDGMVLGGTGATRDFSLVPVVGAYGETTVTLTVTDSGGHATNRSFLLTVEQDLPPEPSLPHHIDLLQDRAYDLEFTIDDDHEAAIPTNIRAGAGGLIASTSIHSGVPDGTWIVRIIPTLGGIGDDSLFIECADANSHVSETEVLITVAADAPPTLSADDTTPTAIEDHDPVAVTLTVGDDNDAASVIIVDATSADAVLLPSGSLVVSGTGATRTLTITPGTGQRGTATITVSATDTGGHQEAIDLTLTVDPDEAPTITVDPDLPLGVDGEVLLTTIEGRTRKSLPFVIADDLDDPADVTTAVTVDPAQAVAVIAGTGATRTLRITPVAGFIGDIPVTVTFTDTFGHAADLDVVLTVQAEEAPTFTVDPDVPLDADGKVLLFARKDGASASFAFTLDDDWDAVANLTIASTVDTDLATLTISGSGAARTVTINPNAGIEGEIEATITATDTYGHRGTLEVLLSVGPDHAPTITVDPALPRNSNGKVLLDILADHGTATLPFAVADDIDAVADLTVAVAVNNGTAAASGTGIHRTLTVTPPAGFIGTLTATITVTDTTGHHSTLGVVITVGADQPPTITVDPDLPRGADDEVLLEAVVDRDPTTLVFTIADDSDAIADLTVEAEVDEGTATISGTGAERTLTVTPPAGFVGELTATITVTDAYNHDATLVVLITVEPDLPPVLTVPGKQVVLMDSSSGNLVVTAVDDHGDVVTITVSAADTSLIPAGGLTLTGSGGTYLLKVTPNAGKTGTTLVIVRARDAAGHETEESFTVEVSRTPPPPNKGDSLAPIEGGGGCGLGGSTAVLLAVLAFCLRQGALMSKRRRRKPAAK